MLRINHLDLRIGNRILAHDLNAHWKAGSLVCVLGPNGSGKSTLLSTIAGIKPIEADRIFLAGDDLSQIDVLNRARCISSIAQNDEADLNTLAHDRIAHGLYPRGCAIGYAKELTVVNQIAATLGIGDLLTRPLYSLSGGQRKKVHIARALVNDEANVYILDEPDANLDAASRDHLMVVLQELCAQNKLVIVSLHHRDLAERYANETFELPHN